MTIKEQCRITGVTDLLRPPFRYANIALGEVLAEFNPTRTWPIKTNDLASDDLESRYFAEVKPFHEGGFSDIYKAWDVNMQRLVAVKVINEDLRLDQKTTELEAKTMASINHPGVPTIYDFTYALTPNGELKPVMIMEYIREESLQERLNKEVIQPDQAIEIVKQVASTIDYMDKNHQLYHGDISPDQILLAKPHLKIVDFATSSAISTGEEYTEGFVAPERASDGIRNSATEEFSLAAVAYHMITGKTVKVDRNQKGVVISKFAKIPKWNLKYNFENTDMEFLNQVFEKALNTNPENRYATSSEFAEAFEQAIKNTAINSTTISHLIRGVLQF